MEITSTSKPISSLQAFSKHGRATTTTDLINQVEEAFSRLFESETSL